MRPHAGQSHDATRASTDVSGDWWSPALGALCYSRSHILTGSMAGSECADDYETVALHSGEFRRVSHPITMLSAIWGKAKTDRRIFEEDKVTQNNKKIGQTYANQNNPKLKR